MFGYEGVPQELDRISDSHNYDIVQQHDILVNNLKSFTSLKALYIDEINGLGRDIS